MPEILTGTWNLHGKCVDQETDAFVVPIVLNVTGGGNFEGTGTGTDYTGEPMNITISGTYNSSINQISGQISMYFLNSGHTRVDSFVIELKEDTGYFPMPNISGGGCPAEAKLVKQ